MMTVVVNYEEIQEQINKSIILGEILGVHANVVFLPRGADATRGESPVEAMRRTEQRKIGT